MTDDDYVCKICSHKATGIHFGVKSCDECKVSQRLLISSSISLLS